MVSDASTLAPSSADSGTAAAPRIPAIDVARGVAIVAMVIYHLTWDLGHFNFIELQAGEDPAWRMFAKLIAGSFLLLVGIGLVLADRDGLQRGPYARRLMFVTGGAL
ncbi:MAG: heparan-alpha-glucosaminide N-acetyltransferase domain-containing protein, partial [Alsobacter sp.]